jgi:integrase
VQVTGIHRGRDTHSGIGAGCAKTGQATESAGLPGFHIHDLRHTGNHIAATTGASLRELMGRMVHSTTRAALIYQHRTAERDRLIAAAISQIIKTELTDPQSQSGTQGPR